jgi:hypothetical protein
MGSLSTESTNQLQTKNIREKIAENIRKKNKYSIFLSLYFKQQSITSIYLLCMFIEFGIINNLEAEVYGKMMFTDLQD